nr:cytochrome c biogenesis protein [Aneura pinguis]WGO59060.1 cytochrome c biogenesis protein [Aneura pinguis]WGO60694.1 cytochrome c biogenesis protein [Aneura pinguis]
MCYTIQRNFKSLTMTLIILEQILANISFPLPLLITLIHWGRFMRIDNKAVEAMEEKGTVIAFLCMTVFLSIRWILSKHFPLSNLYESSMFLSWNSTLIHLVLVGRGRDGWAGIVTAPGAMLTHGFATLGLPEEMHEPLQLVPALKSHWLIMHVTAMILSYAALLCGSLLAITLLVVTTTRRKEFISSPISCYLNLDHIKLMKNSNYSYDSQISLLYFINFRKWQLVRELDGWSYRTIGLGFPLLTVGILSGAVWANEAWGSYWNWDPKETWALITWLIFATYLHSRMIRIRCRKRSALIGSLGFFIIWICYLGVNLVGKGLHSYGWLL